MKLTVSKNPEAIKESGGGSSYINRSGIYEVLLNYVQVQETKNGAYKLNFNVKYNGVDQTIYGPPLVNTDGKLNEITKNLFNRLCIIAGMEDGQEIETETAEFPVGKDQKMTQMEIIPELSDLPVIMRIQMEYGLYDGQVQERKNIRAFYREDGATAQEAESGQDIGRRLKLDSEKYANDVTYKDGLDEEQVQAWIQERINNSSNSASSAPKAKTTARRPMFGKQA